MFTKSKIIFAVACLFLSLHVHSASSKTEIASSSLGHQEDKSFSIPVGGDKITPVDYTDTNNWLALPKKEELKQKVDIFFIYPTAWQANGAYPIADINNKEMRYYANYYLKFRASVFETVGNIFAPYYRQLDALYMTKLGIRKARIYVQGVPKTDIIAAFDYYIKNLNDGRPFILLGHSQGSIMIAEILSDYMKVNPKVYKRMIAAYAIGAPLDKVYYSQNPHVKPAKNDKDLGVVICYNTEAPVVDGKNPLAVANAVLINPISWKTTEEYAPKEENLGSLYASIEGKTIKFEHIADAKIDYKRGVLICSTVDREKWGSQKASRAYFPLGVFHENDINLYYYNLRKNAEDRVAEYFKSSKI